MSGPAVAVVGGGLAGLVAARHLADAGAEVTVFERRPEVGGRVRTTRRDGFTTDRGFQVLFTAYPSARRELDYDRLDLRRFRPGGVVCRPGRRSVLADPLRDPRGAVASALNPEVGLGDKLRTLALRTALRGRDRTRVFGGAGPDRTIAASLRDRGFSERYLRRFVAPFYGGITLDRSLRTSRRVFEYTFACLAAGDTVVPAAGMGAIADQLRARAEAAGAAVEDGAAIDRVELRGRRADRRGGEDGPLADAGPTAGGGPSTDGGTAAGRSGDRSGSSPQAGRDGGDGTGEVAVELAGETAAADAVVVATGAREARRLTGVDAIPTAGVGCVTQWYACDRPLDTDGRILLNAADDRPNQVVEHTAVAPEYAPRDTTLLSATFLGGRTDPGTDRTDADGAEPAEMPETPETPDPGAGGRAGDRAADRDDPPIDGLGDPYDVPAPELAAETAATLSAWYPERSFDPEVVATDRIPFAQFAQPPGIHDRLPDVRAPAGPVYLAGEFTEWSAIDGALESGRRAARAVGRDLGLPGY